MIIMANELKEFLSKDDICGDDFIAVLEWFKEWNFDIPFILARHNYFDQGTNYSDAEDAVDLLLEGYETISDRQKLFVCRVLLEQLEDRIEDSPSNLQNTFQYSINVVKGKVEAR